MHIARDAVHLSLMIGISNGCIYSGIPALVTKVLKGSEGRAVGLYRMFFDVGGICGPFVVTVADYYVMVMPFYVITVLMVSNLTFFG